MKYFLIAFFIVTALTVCAQPGSLDNSFEEDGKAYLHGEYIGCNDMALQKDGKIIQGVLVHLMGLMGFILPALIPMAVLIKRLEIKEGL